MFGCLIGFDMHDGACSSSPVGEKCTGNVLCLPKGAEAPVGPLRIAPYFTRRVGSCLARTLVLLSAGLQKPKQTERLLGPHHVASPCRPEHTTRLPFYKCAGPIPKEISQMKRDPTNDYSSAVPLFFLAFFYLALSVPAARHVNSRWWHRASAPREPWQ